MTGLDGPSAAALFRPGFPQPSDAVADEDDEEHDDDDDATSTIQEVEEDDENSDAAATITSPPAIPIPRGQANPDDPSLLKEHFSDTDQALSSYNTAFTERPQRSSGESQASTGTKDPQLKRRKTSNTSFVTASDGSNRGLESLEPSATAGNTEPYDRLEAEEPQGESLRARDSTEPETPQALSPSINTTGQNGSATSLLRSQHMQPRDDITNVTGSSSQPVNENPQGNNPQVASGEATLTAKNEAPHGLVRFNIPDPQPLKQELQMRAKFAQHARKRIPRRFTRGKLKDGEIVKVEKMLVRMDICSGQEQPSEEYDEKDSLRVETRVTEKWREFMVVCRESHEDDAVLCLQMYKTRVCGVNKPYVDTTY